MVGGLAMSGEAMPLIMNIDDERLEARAKETERVYAEIVAPVPGATSRPPRPPPRYAGGDGPLLRPAGAGPSRCRSRERGAPATVEAAIHECARPVMIAPPNAGTGAFANVIVAWTAASRPPAPLNIPCPSWPRPPRSHPGRRQHAGRCRRGVPGAQSRPPWAEDHHRRHRSRRRLGPRPRPRLLDYTHGKGADLLVMGAYGRGQVLSFLGMGGATGKVISSCRVPLLLAH